VNKIKNVKKREQNKKRKKTFFYIYGFLGWPSSMLKYKYIFFKQNLWQQFYQTALGNCYGLKLPKC